MEERGNYIIEEQVQKPEKQNIPEIPKKPGRFGKLFKEILGGEFLTSSWSKRQLNYFVFLAAIGVVYISNSYYAESMVRKIDDMNRELKELHVEFISSKSEVMNRSKQSVLIKKLEKSGLKESIDPVRKIIVNQQNHGQ